MRRDLTREVRHLAVRRARLDFAAYRPAWKDDGLVVRGTNAGQSELVSPQQQQLDALLAIGDPLLLRAWFLGEL